MRLVQGYFMRKSLENFCNMEERDCLMIQEVDFGGIVDRRIVRWLLSLLREKVMVSVNYSNFSRD